MGKSKCPPKALADCRSQGKVCYMAKFSPIKEGQYIAGMSIPQRRESSALKAESQGYTTLKDVNNIPSAPHGYAGLGWVLGYKCHSMTPQQEKIRDSYNEMQEKFTLAAFSCNQLGVKNAGERGECMSIEMKGMKLDPVL